MKKTNQILKTSIFALGLAVMVGCGEDDLSQPVISLTGADPFLIELGESFDATNDPGFTATDNEDGDITANVTVDYSDVDGSSTGEYEVTYTVVDEAGNTGSETRMVHVVAGQDAYVGTYNVAETCSDGSSYDYEVNVVAGSGAGELIFQNFGGYGATVNILVTISGATGNVLTVNGSDDGYTFIGSGVLTNGTTSDMKFEFSYSADDGSASLSCDAIYDNF